MQPRLFRYAFICAALFLCAETAQAASLTLAWNRNPEPEVVGYVIEWGNQPGNRPYRIAVGNLTSYTINGLTYGAPYYFAVRAQNTFGVESSPSTEVSRRAGIPVSTTGDFEGDSKSEVA